MWYGTGLQIKSITGGNAHKNLLLVKKGKKYKNVIKYVLINLPKITLLTTFSTKLKTDSVVYT